MNDNSYDEIVSSILVSLDSCVEGNDAILDEKNSKGHLGLRLMKYGVSSTVIFIIYAVLKIGIKFDDSGLYLQPGIE